ncbi:MAG: response regulator transcription factor [Gemmatimonadetes bacterium]|uniref:Response regulator transcription factor n=1 Tax=Candidatus Kutchimonas denitrificans TaxID=3056748 RepID=A0AAE4ZAN9_9BACT|nr:response regulator transcription factor [Gemmatimonadota bacterium]NIR75652.1 response regulator transcription factor [Candidatus Kutchimonas denitrificans]NIR99631.1 response regulator transcription factor [Gemmatimonadota bacterium]NIT65906.1 response regulator transcription factor [Gemmatimonadota bacterium]NIV22075.1 response regulator [Gemmatimonadota bacterium]
MSIRALIVDDEPLAREKIRTLLAEDPEVEVVAECGDGRSAAAAIVEHDPDLVFLDVQMPEVDGFTALDAVRGVRLPIVIFVTAHDEYALRAFEVHALDYLLKPFDRGRFTAALARAKERVYSDRRSADRDPVFELLDELRRERRGRWLDRLVVKARGRVFFVPANAIDWIEAAGNYVELHVGSESHLIRSTMKAMEERLDPARFLRVQRSAIVNISRIQHIEPWSSGEYLITLKSGAAVQSGASYREALKALMENPG